MTGGKKILKNILRLYRPFTLLKVQENGANMLHPTHCNRLTDVLHDVGTCWHILEHVA